MLPAFSMAVSASDSMTCRHVQSDTPDDAYILNTSSYTANGSFPLRFPKERCCIIFIG